MPTSTHHPSDTAILPTYTKEIPAVTDLPTTPDAPRPTETAVPQPTETPLPTNIVHQSPSISGSGGGVIAFTSDRDGNNEIYVIYTDSSDQRRLTDHPFSDTSPMWSPDGTLIAFVSCCDHRDIYIMNSDGSNLRQLKDHTSDDINPVWPPDGTYIGFVSHRDRNAEIYQVTLDGQDLCARRCCQTAKGKRSLREES